MCVLFIILKKLAAATTGVLDAMTGFYMVRKQLYLKNDRNYKLLSGVYAVSCCGQSTFFSMFFHIFAIFRTIYKWQVLCTAPIFSPGFEWSPPDRASQRGHDAIRFSAQGKKTYKWEEMRGNEKTWRQREKWLLSMSAIYYWLSIMVYPCWVKCWVFKGDDVVQLCHLFWLL